MASTLQEIVDTQSADLDAARVLADEYVLAHPDEFSELHDLTIPELVTAVDAFRNAGPAFVKNQHQVEVWLLHHFEPQNIGGEYVAQVRVSPDQEV